MNNQQFHYNTNPENFVDIPARSVVFLLKKMGIYNLFEKHAKDGRGKKSLYPIASLLMVALQMLLFRSPSKNDFYQNRKLKRGHFYKNIGALAQMSDLRFPHSKTIDDAFLSLDPSSLEPLLFDLFKKLLSSKLFINHPSLKKNGTYRLAIDTTCSHVYYPHSQHPCEACPFCLKREHKTEGKTKTWYLHLDMIASLIFENGLQIPICLYRIRKRKGWENLKDEDLKQECEQTALPSILKKIRTYLPKLKITILLDGLHSNQTSFSTLEKFNCNWDTVLKRLKSVQEQIDPITCQTRLLESKRFFLTQTASFTNAITYTRFTLNAIEFKEHAEKKLTKRFAKITTKDVYYQWITPQKVDEVNVFNKIEEARSRWHEEDFFNTAKNRGFNLKHDYSRHPSCQSIWLLLILIAFALTSILQLSDVGIQSRKDATICGWMKQMLQDLFYLSYECIFLCSYPKQLRFSLWLNAG